MYSNAVQDVLAERERQVDEECWSPDHDDTHENGEMAQAAACYALGFIPTDVLCPDRYRRDLWPFDREWWKPKDRRRNLVRAGALILAEIERLDRVEPKP